MKIVRENINFERGLDPKKALDLGIEQSIKKFLKEIGQQSSSIDHEMKICVRYGKTDFVDYLIKNGANVHSEGDLALKIACNKGDTDTVRVLLKNGANANTIRLDSSYNIKRWKREIKDLIRQYQNKIKENLNFERGLDPKKAMGLGSKMLAMIRDLHNEFQPTMWNLFGRPEDRAGFALKGTLMQIYFDKEDPSKAFTKNCRKMNCTVDQIDLIKTILQNEFDLEVKYLK